MKLKNGWLGKLNLNFSLKMGRTVLTKKDHCGPFFVQKSFYPKSDNDTPHVYLLHPPGGLVGGDRLSLDVTLEPGSRALLTTPGSTKFYRTNGMYVFQEYRFKLLSNSVLEWVPQSSIFFPKSKVKANITFELDYGARMISFEMLCFNNLSLNNSFVNPEEIDIFSRIRLPYSVGLRDRLRMCSSDCINKLSGFQVIASIFAVPSDKIMLNKVRTLIKSMYNVQIGGATLLDELLVVRLLSQKNQELRELLQQIWNVIRPVIVGNQVVIPRVWFT